MSVGMIVIGSAHARSPPMYSNRTDEYRRPRSTRYASGTSWYGESVCCTRPRLLVEFFLNDAKNLRIATQWLAEWIFLGRA